MTLPEIYDVHLLSLRQSIINNCVKGWDFPEVKGPWKYRVFIFLALVHFAGLV